MIDPDNFSPPPPPHRARVSGVLITTGSQVVIPPGGLKLFHGESGIGGGSVELHLSLSMCPIWCDLAVAHLSVARECRIRTVEAWETTSDDAFANALLAEATVSMQALVAAATAVDALYAGIKDSHTLPDDVVAAWKRNGTARFKQVAELLRRALQIKPRKAVLVRKALQHIYEFRDWSVHPPARAREPLRHPSFNAVMDWRLATFTYQNARELVRAALSLCAQVAAKGKGSDDRLKNYCTGLHELLQAPVARWNAAFGDLEPRKPDAA